MEVVIFHYFIGQSQPQVDPNSTQNVAQSSYLEEYVLKTPKLFENGSVVIELWSLRAVLKIDFFKEKRRYRAPQELKRLNFMTMWS